MVIKNALMTVGVRITLIVTGLATTIITARWLGPSGRGDYFYVIAMSAIAGQVVHLGLHASNAFYVAKNGKLFTPLAVNSYWISVVLGIFSAAMAILVVVAVSESKHSISSLYWALVLTPVGLATLYISNLYVGADRIKEYNAIQLAGVVMPFTLICGTALFIRSAPAFLAAAAIAGVLNQVLLAGYSLFGKSAYWGFDRVLFRAGLPYATRAYVVNALTTLALKAPALMFTTMALKTELGYYSVASQVFDTVSVVPASIAAVLFPVLMRLGVDRWRQTLRFMAILMGMATICALVLGVYADLFVGILFGVKFYGAVAPLRVILPAAVFVSGTSILSQYLATHGMPRSTALAWFAAASICMATGPVMVRTYGAVGASLVLSGATAVAWIILMGLSMRASRKFGYEAPTEAVNVA